MRGRAYHVAGRVEQVTAEQDEWVRARVRGTSTYVVTLHREGGMADVACTCPRFESGSYCKHIWATLVDMVERGTLKSAQPLSGDLPIDQVQPRPPKARKRSTVLSPSNPKEPAWMRRLNQLGPTALRNEATLPTIGYLQQQVCYVVQADLSRQHNGLVITLHQRRPTRKGWSRLKPLNINGQVVRMLADPVDRELCALLLGAAWVDGYDSGAYRDDRARASFLLPTPAQRMFLQRVIQTGRGFVQAETAIQAGPSPLVWEGEAGSLSDRQEPWVLWLVGTPADGQLTVGLELRRGPERLAIEQSSLLLGGLHGLAIWDGKVAPFDDCDAFGWVAQFRDEERPAHGHAAPLQVPSDEVERFLDHLYRLRHLPQIDLPTHLGRPEQDIEPVPHLDLFSSGAGSSGTATLAQTQVLAKVWFAYGNQQVKPGQTGRLVPIRSDPDSESLGLMNRDPHREAQALAELAGLGFREYHQMPAEQIRGQRPLLGHRGGDELGVSLSQTEWQWRLPTKLMPAVCAELTGRGWIVSADQRGVHGPKTHHLKVTSGIDWFELRGQIRYETDQGDQEISLPTILEAARAGRHTVQLQDGSEGLLPEQWLARHGLVFGAGSLHDDHLRFAPRQTLLLDALLREQEHADVDAKFDVVRGRLATFKAIKPADPAPGFAGELRHYQREGVGWLLFLRWLQMGGILADDMGLGKTVQVLALLDLLYNGPVDDDNHEWRRAEHPTLIVVPRSVVFNWMDEAARFTPNLRVQAYTGAERHVQRRSFSDYHMIVTSYGLMRRDVKELQEHLFAYVVLDEAQAIKNPASQSAKAARVLRAEHRLALTGTPVENHLGDLWSILEFLNPGILGSGTRFMQMVRDGVLSPLNVDAAEHAARALRPFILRRAKQQVLDELPEKTEQTIHCEMHPTQRQIYNQLRDHYRSALLETLPATSGTGMGRSTMMVLEALLRLRQAACHPALIDPEREELPSAKMEVLLDHLTELIDEGHKALVFSQFTSMLALVKQRLNAAGIVYAYLDGQTRDRASCVKRFQTDPACPVFLISLKAGGLGLNLTAAEYVFILDPWWNPAVEAQAIDRAHRIGQTRHVFAYRLICEDTVEQRIIELQEKKKKLADAIVGGQENLLRSLTRVDLEQLLS